MEPKSGLWFALSWRGSILNTNGKFNFDTNKQKEQNVRFQKYFLIIIISLNCPCICKTWMTVVLDMLRNRPQHCTGLEWKQIFGQLRRQAWQEALLREARDWERWKRGTKERGEIYKRQGNRWWAHSCQETKFPDYQILARLPKPLTLRLFLFVELPLLVTMKYYTSKSVRVPHPIRWIILWIILWWSPFQRPTCRLLM